MSPGPALIPSVIPRQTSCPCVSPMSSSISGVSVGGYLGGAAMQPVQFGGVAYSTGQVHVHILQFYQEPVAAFLALALVGFAAGGLGYILALHSK